MDILQPLYEFGALLRFLEENGLIKESLELHTKYNSLSKLYYKVKENLSKAEWEEFEARETIAYCQLVIDIEKNE